MKLYKFHADWCVPCHSLSAIIKDLDYKEVDVETTEGKVLAEKYKVRGLPTMALIDNEGTMKASFTGVRPRAWIDAWLKENNG